MPPSEKDYRQLVTDETMLACKLISLGQTLNLRRPWGPPPAREMRPIPEEEAEGGDEDEEDEVPLVRRKRALEVAQEVNAERTQSMAAAGPSGQGNPYPFKELDRVVADFRLVRFNPNQLVHRHPSNPNHNLILL